MMKKIAMLVMAMVMTIFAMSTIFTVSAVGTADNTETVAYDMNGDGVINVMDLTIMKNLIMNEDSGYRVADAVKIKKLILGISKTENEVGKAARGYNFKEIKVSDESVNFIRNSLSNCELISIKYNAGDLILEDELTVTTLMFEETAETPSKEDVVIRFTAEGTMYIIWTKDGSFKITEECSIGKAVRGYNFKEIKVSDESVNFIRNSLSNCELISIKYNAGDLILEDELTVTTLMFEETAETPSKEDVVITFTVEEETYVIWIKNGEFKVSHS